MISGKLKQGVTNERVLRNIRDTGDATNLFTNVFIMLIKRTWKTSDEILKLVCQNSIQMIVSALISLSMNYVSMKIHL